MRKIRKLYTQHILPLVYDYSMSLSEMVGKLTETVNVLAEDDEMTDHRLDVCEGNIEVLTDRVDLANRGVDNLERQINHIEEEIADIPTDERIQQLQDAIDANSSDIETLDSRVDILESRPDLSSAVAVNTQNISNLQTAVSGKSTVSYNEIVQTGTKIGTITIDGTPTDLYAPSATVIPGADGISYNNTTSGLTAANVQDAIDEVDGAVDTLAGTVSGKSTVSYNEIVQTGTKIGTITIDGTPTDIYAPSATVIPGADGISYDNTTSGLTATNVQDAIDEVDGAVDTLAGTVSGKSTVSYNEIVQTGTKIGTITIDGTPTDLYAPSATVIPGADGISYDNTTSGLTATNVQDAIDEVDGAVDTLSSTVAGKSTVSVSQVVSTGTKIATVTVDSVGTDIYAPAQSTPTASQVSYDNTSSRMSASDVQAAIDELNHDKSYARIYVDPSTGYVYSITTDSRSGTVYTPYPEHDSSGSSPLRLIYNLPTGAFVGYVSSTGMKDIHFFVPTSRDYSNIVIPNASYFSGTGAIRGIAGYVEQSFNISQYSYDYDGAQTAAKRFKVNVQRDGLFISLHNESGFTAGTNNTPIVVYLSNFKFNQPY